MTWGEVLRQVQEFWAAYGGTVLAAGLAGVSVLVAVSFLLARRRKRVQAWMANLAYLAVMVLSAEGMWSVARQRLHLPVLLAGATFFVVEALMVSEAWQATEQYKRTTVRDAEGTIVKPGDPGKHGRSVWMIAVVAGAIVATNAHSLTEFLLRLVLPLSVALMWWNSLTAEGTTRKQGSWRWTPRRLMIAVGAIAPGEEDVEQINRERHIRAMTRLARKIHHGQRPTRFYRSRLERKALMADDAMLAEVHRRIRRGDQVTELTNPAAPPPAELTGGVTGGAAGSGAPGREWAPTLVGLPTGSATTGSGSQTGSTGTGSGSGSGSAPRGGSVATGSGSPRGNGSARPRTTGSTVVPARTSRPARPDGELTPTETARAHWDTERAAGRTPTGAELDRVAGTRDFGRQLRRKWLAEEPIEAEQATQDGSQAFSPAKTQAAGGAQ